MNAIEVDPFASWRSAVEGGKPGIHESEPWCGYFKMKDRKGFAAGLYKSLKDRAWVPCAIYRDWRGNLVAELDGEPCLVDAIWPYAAKNPIHFAEYQQLHEERAK